MDQHDAPKESTSIAAQSIIVMGGKPEAFISVLRPCFHGIPVELSAQAALLLWNSQFIRKQYQDKALHETLIRVGKEVWIVDQPIICLVVLGVRIPNLCEHRRRILGYDFEKV
jgi:hypothetical protein